MLELNDYLLGFRLWKIDTESEKPELFPMVTFSDKAWAPKTNKAYCYNKNHRSPEKLCDCGLYAYHKFLPVRQFACNEERVVYGAVKGFGKMEVYYSGWRSEYAEIVALKDNIFFDSEELSNIYKVPVFKNDVDLLEYANSKATPLLSKDIPKKKLSLPNNKDEQNHLSLKAMLYIATVLIVAFFCLELFVA